MRKSISDLTRRRARVFAVAALALGGGERPAVRAAGADEQAMNREIAANKLTDVTVTVKPLALTRGQLQALGRLPNVAALQPRTTFSTRVHVGSRHF